MLHMSADSGLFRSRVELEAEGYRLEGNVLVGVKGRYLPLYEAKMVQLYNHRYGDYSQLAAGHGGHVLPDVPEARLADRGYSPAPRYWVPQSAVDERLSGRWAGGWLLGWRDVTDARASARTIVAAAIPRVGVGDKYLLMLPAQQADGALLLSMLGSFILDYVSRQKVGGLALKYFTMKQLAFLPPARFLDPCPWHRALTLAAWVVPRVVELTFTAEDMSEFGRDFGYPGLPFSWDSSRRFEIRCELDGAYFHLYGMVRDEVAYILDTFPVVRRSEEKRFGEYRSKRRILEIYDRMQHAINVGAPFMSDLDPPPGDPRASHSPGSNERG